MTKNKKDEETHEDVIEKAFGKSPEKGYKFKYVDVEICNTWFKGFIIRWGAYGIGFGEFTFGFGTKPEYKEQYGFYTDSELMSEEFAQALMKEALPQMVKKIMEYDRPDGKPPMTEEDYSRICDEEREKRKKEQEDAE
jgi:hypothetical protein